MRTIAIAAGLLLLALPSQGLAEAPAPIPGGEARPQPLAGVPLDLRCNALLSPRHPLLDRQSGQDLHDLARTDGEEVDLAKWLDDYLCDLVWQELARSGAHRSPRDVRSPAQARLDVELSAAVLEGTRTVEQRVGSSVLPISVPHWALSVEWTVRFEIHYVRDGQEVVAGTPLNLRRRAGAEQGDYSALRLGALLRATTRGAFGELGSLLADEGSLGDLLFSVVDTPDRAPAELGVQGELAQSFWNLLVPSASHRHDALAFYLASSEPSLQGRWGLASWFLLNDSDLPLRRDALSWLMQQEGPAESEEPLSDETAVLLGWLLARDKSPRMRQEIALALAPRRGEPIRSLLLRASLDSDRRVSDVANGALRHFDPPTASEFATLETEVRPPSLPAWTQALDGRVPLPALNPQRALLELARAAKGPAAETWTVRWLLQGGALSDEDLDWAVSAWEQLAADAEPRIRAATLQRLSRETALLEVEKLLISRILAERTPELRMAAIEGLDRPSAPGALGALLDASKDVDPGVRGTAALALAEAGGSEARARIDVLMRSDRDPQVRRKARKALRLLDRSRTGR